MMFRRLSTNYSAISFSYRPSGRVRLMFWFEAVEYNEFIVFDYLLPTVRLRLAFFARPRPATVIMASMFPIFLVGAIVVALMFLSFLFTPKGQNQVYVPLPPKSSQHLTGP